MGIFKKDELMLDFNGVKTENISSTIPYLNKLDTQVKILKKIKIFHQLSKVL
jgi:hypothetical protein